MSATLDTRWQTLCDVALIGCERQPLPADAGDDALARLCATLPAEGPQALRASAVMAASTIRNMHGLPVSARLLPPTRVRCESHILTIPSEPQV